MPPSAHPYMANSAPAAQAGAARGDRRDARRRAVRADPGRATACSGALELPPALSSEVELRRHLRSCSRRNASCEQTLSFLGGGCWQHHVPAICDEIVGRSEFLTSVWGTPLLRPRPQPGLVRVREPARRAASTWISSGCRSTAGAAPPGTRSAWPRASPAATRCWCRPASIPSASRSSAPTASRARWRATSTSCSVELDPATGLLDLADLERKLSAATAAVYFENPAYLGLIESQAARDRARSRARAAPRRSSASTRSRSACWRRPAATAPTSSSARRSRSACT